jgi:hypothetical protein
MLNNDIHLELTDEQLNALIEKNKNILIKMANL